jgi:hypothetical protein
VVAGALQAFVALERSRGFLSESSRKGPPARQLRKHLLERGWPNLLHRRLVHRLLGSGAKAKEPAPAERDGAGREPGPAEKEPREGVREPVDVEEHARARDGDGDARRTAGQ